MLPFVVATFPTVFIIPVSYTHLSGDFKAQARFITGIWGGLAPEHKTVSRSGENDREDSHRQENGLVFGSKTAPYLCYEPGLRLEIPAADKLPGKGEYVASL